MADELVAEIREQTGKHENRRLRKAGRIPVVLYGHGKENLSLSVSAEDIDALVRRGSRLIDLRGAVSETAFLRELQWDTWGTHVLHVDLTRISAHEKVEVVVGLELRGEAPGMREGGVVDQSMHEIELECPVAAVPDKIEVNVNNLNLDESITVGDLELPEGATVKAAPEAVVVQCVVPAELPEEEEAAEAVAGEPEVIGAKPDEEAEGGE
jgi:large subunit ribosomal protein L25